MDIKEIQNIGMEQLKGFIFNKGQPKSIKVEITRECTAEELEFINCEHRKEWLHPVKGCMQCEKCKGFSQYSMNDCGTYWRWDIGAESINRFVPDA